MRRGILGSILLALILSLLIAPSARAEHLPDHRYFVVGTVTNEFGEAVCGVTVRAADIDKPFSESNRTVATDASGGYSIQLHMHDAFDVEGQRQRPPTEAAVGDRIRVSIEGTDSSSVVVAVKNTATELGWGQQRVDSSVEGLRGRCISTVQLALIGLGIIGALVGGFVAVRFVRRPGRLGRGSRATLREIPGVGRARARELEGFGIRSVEELAAANPNELSRATTLTPKQARLLVKRANDAVGDEG